ncbi:AAA family ATPase [Azospirillum oleiclasticum]|nr:bifunctional aminoglycoside phosphotransferase/ATP-binding protein [Azospirillum oleiclasticum]
MPPDDQTAVVDFLSDPATHGGAPVERIDTHAAMVFLVESRAYKLKRAVRYPYLDFSTRGRRRAACDAELRLNRRTAPAIYEAVVDVVRRADGGLALGGPGEVLDAVLVMRRFDSNGLFDRLAVGRRLTHDHMRALADHIAAFHAAAEPCRGGGASSMRIIVAQNLEEMRGQAGLLDPRTVDRLARRSAEELDRLAPLIEARAAAGFVRHGHGDLHLANIVLLDGQPTLFDCLEFDDALATVDVLYDLAFLLMDLEHRGLRPLANTAFNRYVDKGCGLEGLALLPLFLSVRASIRAKIAAAAARLQPDDSAAAIKRAEAGAYLELARALLEPPLPQLMAVGGLSGSGKSTVARALAPDTGAAPGALVLRSDVIRKTLFGVSPETALPEDAYTPAVTERVYATIVQRATVALEAGHSVIADAVFARAEERDAIAAAAGRCGVPFTGLWLTAPATARAGRIGGRGPDASDATAAVAIRQESYDLGPMAWRRIDADQSVQAVLRCAREALP